MSYEDEDLVEKGKAHFKRHGGGFLSLVSEDFKNFPEALMVLLELVYQDGRFDALSEAQRRIQNGSRG